MKTVTLYTTETYPYCRNAKSWLASRGVKMKEINVHTQEGKRDEMVSRSGRRTVPQIFIEDVYIGGFDDQANLDRKGGLMSMLS